MSSPPMDQETIDRLSYCLILLIDQYGGEVNLSLTSIKMAKINKRKLFYVRDEAKDEMILTTDAQDEMLVN